MKSCRPDQEPGAQDQHLGTGGDGTTGRFALVKAYGTGADAYRRLIVKPMMSSLRVAVDGIEVSSPGDFAFDETSGEIVFTGGAIPENGASVTAGYEFDVPVRFDTERISISLKAFKAGQIPSMPLVEVQL